MGVIGCEQVERGFYFFDLLEMLGDHTRETDVGDKNSNDHYM